MGLFTKLLRPSTHQPSSPPTVIAKPRVMGNGKALNKENNDPRIKSGSRKGQKAGGKKSKKSKKFWNRKQKQEPAPKLSVFLQQIPENDVAGSVTTGSMTASHTTGSNSRQSLSTTSFSTSSSEQQNGPLHLQSSQSAGDVLHQKESNAVQFSAGADNKNVTQLSRGGSPSSAKELSDGDSGLHKTQDISSSETLQKEKEMSPLPSAAERPLTPHPKLLEKASKAKLEVVEKPHKIAGRLKSLETDHSVSSRSARSNNVVFDDLIDNDTANIDLRSNGSTSIDSFPVQDNMEDDAEKLAIQIINMHSLTSPHDDSLSKKSPFPRYSMNGEYAVFGSNQANGGAVVRDVVDLQDIIDEVEKDMMELNSIFGSDVVEPKRSDRTHGSSSRSGNENGWIPNGALRSETTEDPSVMSFTSDEFAEDDYRDTFKQSVSASATSYEITTIIEENESDEDPLEAAFKRGELYSTDAGEGIIYEDEGLLSLGTDECFNKSAMNGSNFADSDLSESLTSASQSRYGESRHTSGSVRTDSDLSDSLASRSKGSSLEKSLSKGSSSRSSGPSRQIKKSISWKAAHEVRTYDQPFKSINLELAVQMVRSYDPRYAKETSPPPLSRAKAERPLKSILRKSSSWSVRDISSSDESSISQESNSSTLSSSATSESVQYMVRKLQREAVRRRRKLKRCRRSKSIG